MGESTNSMAIFKFANCEFTRGSYQWIGFSKNLQETSGFSREIWGAGPAILRLNQSISRSNHFHGRSPNGRHWKRLEYWENMKGLFNSTNKMSISSSLKQTFSSWALDPVVDPDSPVQLQVFPSSASLANPWLKWKPQSAHWVRWIPSPEGTPTMTGS